MTEIAPLFVLIHSPLVGPLSWSLVAEQLRARGHEAMTPSLFATSPHEGQHWSSHVEAVTSALRGVPHDRPVVLVAHSGAGPLLPAIGHSVGHRVAVYLFVDAALPGKDGQSRLDLFDPADAERFRATAVDGMIPGVWRDEALLRAVGIEDASLRRRFIAEVPDVELAVYEEPLPVPVGWPDARCAYVLFSPPYEADARRASTCGWAFRELPGGHFHMLVDPTAVSEALLRLVGDMGV
ncbi:MAG: alpha/beta hydrolase [Dehalococcoidia bacterium]